MADATKNINFHTRVTGTEEAKRKIAGITGELDKTSTTIENKVNPAMEDMAGGMDDTSESTEKLSGKLSGAIGYLIGGAGIAAAVYIAKEAWDDINISFSEGSERLQTLTKDLEYNLSEVYKVKAAWDAFTKSIGKWSEEKLEDAIETLNTRIKSLTLSMIELAFYATIDPSGLFASQLTLEELKKELDLVTKELDKYSAGTKKLVKPTFEVTGATGAFKEEVKRLKKELKELVDVGDATKKVFREMADAWSTRFGGEAGGKLAGGAGAGIVTTGGDANRERIAGATKAGLEDGFDKATEMMNGVSRQWTSTLESNFNEFWDSTFGYANSLLEQLLKATFMSIFGSLLSFLPGGGILGGIISLFDSSSGGGGSRSAPNNIIVLKIGEEEVGSFVNKGNEYNRMRRLN